MRRTMHARALAVPTAALVAGMAAVAAGGAGATGLDAGAPTLVGPAAAQGAAMLKLIAALGVVLLAFWASARVFARFGRGRGAGAAGLEVLGSVALGQRERLVVVRAGSAELVLGVTAHAITPVHVLEGRRNAPDGSARAADADERIERGGSRAGSGAVVAGLPSGPDFAARLRAALGRTDA